MSAIKAIQRRTDSETYKILGMLYINRKTWFEAITLFGRYARLCLALGFLWSFYSIRQRFYYGIFVSPLIKSYLNDAIQLFICTFSFIQAIKPAHCQYLAMIVRKTEQLWIAAFQHTTFTHTPINSSDMNRYICNEFFCCACRVRICLFLHTFQISII